MLTEERFHPTSAARDWAWRAVRLGAAALVCFYAGMLGASRPEDAGEPRDCPVCSSVAAAPSEAPPLAAPPVDARPAFAATDDAPPEIGQSIGVPRAGALQGGAHLRGGDGYRLRNPATTHATVETVAHLEGAIAKARAAYPDLHPVLVGDLSAELGGQLLGHRSHQSGRDVDLGLLYRRRPAGYPQRFTDATEDNLHFRGTLALIEALADTADEPGGVEWILLDYGVQKMLRRFAEREGMPEAELDRLFQFPHGPTASRGLLRHFPGHRNHLHVRFSCPPSDAFCASPVGPPTVQRRLAAGPPGAAQGRRRQARMVEIGP